jgi:hypothetical protein
MRTIRALAIAAATLVAAGGAGAAGPASFQLVLDGRHNAALLHEGTFTTSASWCPSGTAVDLSVEGSTDTATRRFSCAAGGDFTATVRPLPAEHGGSGRWQIVAGSGPLANLRGKGTFASVRLGGSSDDPQTITFRSTWNGFADSDVDPPTIAVTSASARKLKHPTRAYSVRVVLALTDAGGGVVSYILQVVDPKKPTNAFVYKVGRATGAVTSRFRIKVPKKTHLAQIKIDASDAVGNTSTLAKTLRLR